MNSVTVPIVGLPVSLTDFTLAHFSDLHIGAFMDAEQLRPIIDRINSVQADTIVFTGDLMDFSCDWQGISSESLVKQLLRLRAPQGVFAVLGNHDYYSGSDKVANIISMMGMTLLRNEGQMISKGKDQLWLAGVDDVEAKEHDLDAALLGVPRSCPTILLAHEPDYADLVSADGRVILQLSGHSHGGQVRLPFIDVPLLPLPYLGTKYPSGLCRVGDMWLYTNRGVGMTVLPLRLNCPPEITVIKLVVA